MALRKNAATGEKGSLVRPAGRLDSGVMPTPWRVLVVDDDVDARWIAAECLKLAGFEVLEAENGMAAIDVAIRLKPDLVVMDLEMPVMGGLEAIRRLKADTRTCAIHLIVLSANVFTEHAEARRAGCTTCLVKPCSPIDLEGTVRAVLDG
jgi:CheY-like chemotaxis protein